MPIDKAEMLREILTALEIQAVEVGEKNITLSHDELAKVTGMILVGVRQLKELIGAAAAESPMVDAATNAVHFLAHLPKSLHAMDEAMHEQDEEDDEDDNEDCPHPEVRPCGDHGHCRFCGRKVVRVGFNAFPNKDQSPS